MAMGSKSVKLALSAAALAQLAVIAAPSAVQAQSSERVFVDLGRWTVYERGDRRTCVLRLGPENGASLAYVKTGSSAGTLTLETNRRTSGFVGDIQWEFDDDEFEGRLIGNGVYTPVAGGSAIEAAFRQARFVTVTHGGATIARVNLQTSSAGYRLLEQCAGQWRRGFANLGTALSRQREAREAASRPARTAATTPAPAASDAAPSAPPPPSSQPAATRPAPTTSRSRDPVPRNPARWLEGADFGRADPPRTGGGVLDYSLIVNPRGRAEECVVNRSSGSREYDQLACRYLLRRARFDPALDVQGNQVEGRYRSSIRFEVPE